MRFFILPTIHCSRPSAGRPYPASLSLPCSARPPRARARGNAVRIPQQPSRRPLHPDAPTHTSPHALHYSTATRLLLLLFLLRSELTPPPLLATHTAADLSLEPRCASERPKPSKGLKPAAAPPALRAAALRTSAAPRHRNTATTRRQHGDNTATHNGGAPSGAPSGRSAQRSAQRPPQK